MPLRRRLGPVAESVTAYGSMHDAVLQRPLHRPLHGVVAQAGQLREVFVARKPAAGTPVEPRGEEPQHGQVRGGRFSREVTHHPRPFGESDRLMLASAPAAGHQTSPPCPRCWLDWPWLLHLSRRPVLALGPAFRFRGDTTPNPFVRPGAPGGAAWSVGLS